MGDGCLTLKGHAKNAYLRWSHGPVQRDYLIWKARQFGALFRSCDPKESLKRDGKLHLSLSSISHPLLTEQYRRFYTRPLKEKTCHVLGKCVPEDIWHDMDDLALAIWFCDDGTTVFPRRLAICAGAMVEEDYLRIEGWFNKQGMNPVRAKWMSYDQNSIELRFSEVESKHLALRIKPHVPECMRFKFKELLS